MIDRLLIVDIISTPVTPHQSLGALMNAKKLVELRQAAEKAVSDMPDGDLKVKAFEVILGHMMEQETDDDLKPARRAPKHSKRAEKVNEKANSKSSVGRILVLREEGFFKNQKSIAEVCDALASNGWHYPQSSLSGPLMTLVQRRELRRTSGKKGNKKLWLYSEY
jgi:hypothetical protein